MKYRTSLAAARTRRFTTLQSLSFAVLASGALLAARSARAQTAYTDTGSTGLFSTAITPTVTADTSYLNGDSLTFSNTATSAQTDDLTTALNFNVLTFSNTAALTLSQGAGTTLTLGSTAGGTAPTVNLNNTGTIANGLNVVLANNTTFAGSGSATFSGVVSGGGSLIKTGAGTLTLSGANTYSGGTSITGGTLSISSDGNLGSTAAANGVSLNGGTLDTGGSSLTLSANHGITVGANGGTLTSTVGGNAIMFTSANTLSGSGALLFQGNTGGNNAYRFGAAQNISGAITVDNTRLVLDAGATLGTSAITIHGNAELLPTAALTLGNNLFLSGNNADGYGAIRSFASLTLNGNVTLQGDTYISSQGGSTTIALNGTTTGAFTLYFGNSNASNGSANYAINGADNATATSINNGSLTLGTSTAAQNTMLTGGSGGTVKFAPGVGTFFASSLAGNEAIGLADTGGAPVTLSVGATQTYSGTLTGGAGSALTYTGTGEAHFQAAATSFAGAINVNTTGNGKLDTNVSLGSGGSYNVSSGSTLFVFGGTLANTVFNLSGGGNGEFLGALRLDGGNIDATSTINLLTNTSIGGNGGTATIAGVIAGTAGFQKTGGDTLILSGANTFSGTTNLGGSTLNLSNALALQNSTLNYTGGALVFDSSVTGNAFTLGGLSGGQSIALQNNAGTPAAIALTFGGNNSSQTFSGNLTGPGSIIKAGTGTQSFGGTNSLTGGFTVGNGIAYLTNSNQPGAGTLTFGTVGAANTTVLAFSQGGRTFNNPIVTQGTGGANIIQPQGGGQNFSFSGGITLGNNLTLTTNNGSDSISIDTGAIGGTGNLVTNVSTISAGGPTAVGTVNPSGGGISLNSAINNVGTISNVGNGTSTVTINGAIGSNVTSVIQNSTTSLLSLSSGGGGSGTLQVLNGLVAANGGYFTDSTGAGTVTLGTAGAANTTGIYFSVFGRTFNNPIVTQGTGGTNTIQVQGGGQGFTLAGGVTLGNNLTFSTYAGSDSITETGNITGTGSLVTNVNTTGINGATGGGSGGNIAFNGSINHTGTFSNIGNGSSTVTVNGVIGTNVTGVVQNSATSGLTLNNTNTYAGPTTVSAGLLTITSTGSINGSALVSVANTGALTLTNSASLSNVGTLSLVTGATLNLNDPNTGGTASETIGNLILNGTTEPAGTYTTTQLAGLPGASGITFANLAGETLTIAAVPEPSTWLSGVFCLGALGLFVRRRMAAGASQDRRVA